METKQDRMAYRRHNTYMKLKSIRLLGFKSFADDTKIELQDAITCIVGPNGCGKSNILDALRWVLGEKSARGLRGQQMEDLIFLGSGLRKPAGMAEVEICFDNRDRSLQINQDEFRISRRLYVSSASEYYLDSKRIKRRELEKIFLNTGIGKNAYSIIEQGKISEILQASPEMRRSLLDEAAGISRFKLERQESLRRLKETKGNLLRLNDIFKSKEKEIEKLEKQAQQTQEYLNIKERLDKHDRYFRYLEIRELGNEYSQVQEALKLLQNKREKTLEEGKEWEKKKIELEQSNRSRLEEAHRLDRSYHESLTTLKSLEKRKLWISKEQKERLSRSQELYQRFETEEKKHKNVQRQHNDFLQLELNLKTDLHKIKEERGIVQENIAHLQVELEEIEKSEKGNLVNIQTKERKYQDLLKELKDVASELLLELEQKRKAMQSCKSSQFQLRKEIEQNIKNSAESIKILRKSLLEEKNLEKATHNLKKLSPERILNILEGFQRYDAQEAEFRSFFLDPSGLMGRKEKLDQKMLEVMKDIEDLKKNIRELQKKKSENSSSLEKNKNKKQELDLHIRDYEVRQESHIERQKNIQSLLQESKERLEYFMQARKDQESSLKKIQEEERELGKEQDTRAKQLKEREKILKSLTPAIDKDKEEIEKLSKKIQKVRENSEKILPQISKQERASELLRAQLSQNEENLYNDFQMKFSDLEKECASLHLNKKEEEAKRLSLHKEIQDIGTFNALAIEELEKSQESLSKLQNQRKDIEEATKNILDALKAVEKKSRESFQETFKAVQENFENVFAKLFAGGKAYLRLSDPQDLLNSGIDIIAQPPGKKNTSVALLSGGEQSMTALALIFALYLVRPSPFCFLDEVDAPLDDTNVKRFLEMLSEYTPHTQFLIITHNKITMSRAKAIFGVTQEEKGVSRLVSVRLVEKELQSA